MSPADAHGALDLVVRREWPRLVAGLVRVTRGDVGLAEELAQDAIVAALTQWPSAGLPDNPGAWLQAAAKNRGLTALAHQAMAARKHAQIVAVDEARQAEIPDLAEGAGGADVGDDMLRLILIACDPALPVEGRVALTLRLLGGLTTEEIARAFLVPEPTIAQRIVRAKRTLAEAGRPFEVPRGEALAERLSSVLGVIYLVYNEGYAATAGDDLLRPQLCQDALRLAAMLAEHVPAEAEAHGLLALLELQESRAPARVDAQGDPVLLLEQDRSSWDRARIARGLAALERARALGPSPRRYALQAAIAACHARAAVAEETDWAAIVTFYDALARAAPSPVVALNRAMAIAMARGPAAGLAALEPLEGDPALARYHLLPSARADLLERLGRDLEAAEAFDRAASLTDNARQRRRLAGRAEACRARAPRGAAAPRTAR